jgi:hypothetical protein
MTEGKRRRKPRFKRDPANAPGFRLTERDIEIIKLVHKHRFLSSEQIFALIEGSTQQLARRLQLLFHAGYLDRPKAQLARVHEGIFNQPMVYALGKEGALLLSLRMDVPLSKVDWSAKNRESKGLFIDHTLMVADFMIAIQLACEQTPGLRYIDTEAIINNRPVSAPGKTGPLSWVVNIPIRDGKKWPMTMVPDGAFGIEITDQTGQKEIKYFFLEGDRSSMPITRSTLAKSSFQKKMQGYILSFKDKLYSQNFGFKKIQVLTVAISNARIESMLKLNTLLDPQKKGYGLFLFTRDIAVDPTNPKNILGKTWVNGRGERVRLID